MAVSLRRKLRPKPSLLPSTLLVGRLECRRALATLYAVGESWTGALGNGHLDPDVAGHYDDEMLDDALTPVYQGNIQDVSVGWGHTAIITKEKKQRILLTGRPHDFMALLRVKRLPRWLRVYSAKQTLQSSVSFSQQTSAANNNKSDKYDLSNPTELVGGLVTWLSQIFTPTSKDWETARKQSIMAEFTPLLHENYHQNDDPVRIECSAGFSAYITSQGHVYAFGLNGYGQCGTGFTANNVWQPTRVTGLNAGYATEKRSDMEQSAPVTDLALGLQHGVCLNSQGEAFCWGKGERGQLGQESTMAESHTALPIKRALHLEERQDETTAPPKPTYLAVGKIVQIAAGMVHSAALTQDNQVLIWGKHVLAAYGVDVGKKPASDAVLPYVLKGLPDSCTVERIACGSHHTSVLLKDGSVWAVGISADSSEPMFSPVMLIAPGIVEMPVRQFAAHADRTTVVGHSGRQVLQAHLWKDPELQEYAVFTPSWIEQLLDQNDSTRVREVHRSWVHSIAVAD